MRRIGDVAGAVQRAVAGASALIALGLLLGQTGRTEAQETSRWEAVGPAEQSIGRLYTPPSGALLASTSNGLIRSDDAGETWRTIERPEGTSIISVSPTDHDLLYAAGRAGVLRTEDGGASWQRVSEQGGDWRKLEISPADPSILYGVIVTSPPSVYGTNHWHEFWVSRDAGATWENVRTHHERFLPGSQPCAYTVNLLLPHSISTNRVLTIEGCTGRGMDPLASFSPNENRNLEIIPTAQSDSWSANAAVGGDGVRPERWYVSLYRPGISYSRIRHSRVMRSDDDGLTWTTIFEDDGGAPDRNMAKTMDFVSELTYDRQRPDHMYALFNHYEPGEPAYKEHRQTGSTVRVSRDGGVSWSDLGVPDGQTVTELAVGVDGRYLFAATGHGVYRIGLPQ